MSEQQNQRQHRIGQLLQQELGQLVSRELKDPRVGFVTIPEVWVAPDLKSARVYISVYGSEQERRETLQGLTAAAGFLQRALGGRLELKHIPKLVFELDESLDRAERLDALFDAIERGETELPDQPAAEPLPVQTGRRDRSTQGPDDAQSSEASTKRARRGRKGKRRRSKRR